MTRPPFGIGKERWFADNGYGKPRGVVHVGINDGTELGWYLQEGEIPILAFEPYFPVYQQTCIDFQAEIDSGLIKLYDYALSDENSQLGSFKIPVRIIDGVEATQGASLLEELNLDPSYKIVNKEKALIERFDKLVLVFEWDLSPYDLLVVDVQGMEFQVLKGFGDCLDGFKYLIVECSEQPIFYGEAPASVVCDWLTTKGFHRMTPILSHNDILFLRQ